MIRIFKLLFLLVISQVAFAQAPSNYTNINGRYRWIAGMFDSTFHIPKGTNPSLRTGGSTNAGALFYKTGDSSLYIYTGTQWLKQAGTAGFVPYSGATDTLDMGQFGLKTKFVQFDTSSRAVTDRTLLWSNDDGTLQFGMTNGGTITQRIGLEQFARVKNVQGSQINKGQVVYIYGASGDRASVKLADNRADSTSSKTLGVAAENIPINDVGLVATFGTVSNLNLSTYTPGDILYLDSIPGGLTKTKPQAPYHLVFIGVVERANSGNGLLFVSPQNGYELEELHNVKITSPVNNKAVLIYDSINRLWIDTTVAGAGLAVTSVATNTGTGITGGTITTTGTLAIDTLLISTRAWRQKGVDSLQANINLKVNISDTSSMLSPYLRKADTTAMLQNYVNNVGFGLDKAGQVVSVDTLEMSTRAWRQKGIDSVASLINTRVSGTTNYIPKFTSSSAIGNSTMFTDANGNIIVSSGQTWGTSAGGLNLSSVSDDGYVTTYYDNKNLTLGAGVTSKNRIVIEGQAGGNNINFNVFGSERMRLTSTGLGIGTSSPAVGLQVQDAGNTYAVNISGNNQTNGVAIGTLSTNVAVIQGYTRTFSAYNDIVLQPSGGNLGLGVTPSAWSAGKAFEMTSVGNGVWASPDIYLFRNSYYNSGWKYAANGAAGNYYIGSSGEHVWSQAASGTAGNAISFTQAMTLAASGNLGIGVTNPDSYNSYAYRLVVGGLANSGITIAGDASEGSSNLYFADGTTGDQAYRGQIAYTHSNDYMYFATAATTRMTITNGGLVGIGTSSPGRLLNVSGGGTDGTQVQINGTVDAAGIKLIPPSGDNWEIQANTSNQFFVYNRTDGAYRFLIDGSGNVGIGTTSPAAKLDVGYVAGAVALRVSRGSSDILDFYQGGGVSYIDASASGGQIAFATVGSERMRITSAGNVGIGTTSPAANLSLSGSGDIGMRIKAGSTNLSYIDFDEADSGTPNGSIAYNHASNAMTFATGGSNAERMRINSAGRVSIGTTVDLGRNLVIGGTSSTARVVPATDNVGYVGDVSYRWEAIYAVNGTIQTSDAREKREIKTTNLGLDFVKSLNPVSYKWNENYSDNRTHYGLIAQQVKTAIPTGVDFGGLIEEENNGRKSIVYTEFIAVLIKAIQEQQAQIEELKSKIK